MLVYPLVSYLPSAVAVVCNEGVTVQYNSNSDNTTRPLYSIGRSQGQCSSANSAAESSCNPLSILDCLEPLQSGQGKNRVCCFVRPVYTSIHIVYNNSTPRSAFFDHLGHLLLCQNLRILLLRELSIFPHHKIHVKKLSF